MDQCCHPVSHVPWLEADHGRSPWYKSDRALVNTLLDIGSSAGASCTILHRGIHSCSIYYIEDHDPNHQDILNNNTRIVNCELVDINQRNCVLTSWMYQCQSASSRLWDFINFLLNSHYYCQSNILILLGN